MSRAAVSAVCVVVFLLIVSWDLYLDHDRVKGNTISARARALGRAWPPARLLIIFALGLVFGHFWWTPQDVYDTGGAECITQQQDAGAK